MCSTYTLKTDADELLKIFEKIKTKPDEIIEGRFTVNQMAPVISKFGLQSMNFSLIPSWSKERKVKFATHNARLFDEDGKTPIYKKPTWRGPFSNNHCIVPISKFIEPIYTGNFAGNMVRFYGDQLMYAAGICDSWVDKNTGEVVDSFSILTDDPVKFVANVGHDRTPIFISEKAAKEWLTLKESPDDLVAFLRSNRAEPRKWEVEIDRAMKAGWEKRIPK